MAIQQVHVIYDTSYLADPFPLWDLGACWWVKVIPVVPVSIQKEIASLIEGEKHEVGRRARGNFTLLLATGILQEPDAGKDISGQPKHLLGYDSQTDKNLLECAIDYTERGAASYVATRDHGIMIEVIRRQQGGMNIYCGTDGKAMLFASPPAKCPTCSCDLFSIEELIKYVEENEGVRSPKALPHSGEREVSFCQVRDRFDWGPYSYPCAYLGRKFAMDEARFKFYDLGDFHDATQNYHYTHPALALRDTIRFIHSDNMSYGDSATNGLTRLPDHETARIICVHCGDIVLDVLLDQ